MTSSPVGQSSDKRVIVALDFATSTLALEFAKRLDPQQCRVKVGKQLFTLAGPSVVQELVERQFDVFLDLKFHDIPNTVAGACRAAAELGCWMVNVHASGGAAMMEAAVASVQGVRRKPVMIAVTVLTSIDAKALKEVGISLDLQSQVNQLARLAQTAGMDGVVCSPQEIETVRQLCGSNFTIVTPGIRPSKSANDDQVRIATPASAVQAGSNYLVIGRPITQAPDPVAALARINALVDDAISTA